MESKRIYIGGLYYEATNKDVTQLFSKFGEVESVEIKKRLENNAVNYVFGYVNLKTTSIDITKCFRRLNGTFWKGQRLKLELARESFLSRLQRERQQNGAAAAVRTPDRPLSPPKRKSLQERILDDVLAKKRRGGVAVDGQPTPNGVVDFTEDVGAARPAGVSPPPAERRRSAGARSVGSHTAPGEARLEATEQAEQAGQTEEVPSRGTLRMFGGIVACSEKKKRKKVMGENEQGDVGPSVRADRASGTQPATVAAGDGRRTGRTSHARPPADVAGSAQQPSDFLSRLEAFSAVWNGDDGGACEPSAACRGSTRSRDTPARSDRASCPPASPPTETDPSPVPPTTAAAADPSPVKSTSPVGSAQPAAEATSSGATAAPARRAAASTQQDNQRRIDSLRLKQEAFKSQKRALQLALSSKAGTPKPNKRIVFDDLEANDSVTSATSTPSKIGQSLFDGDHDEEAEDADAFRIRPQYEGEKGQKLQALQSRFGGDGRFVLDERFADERSASAVKAEPPDEDGLAQEHTTQMGILQSVLGRPVQSVSNERKDTNKVASIHEATRYDPSLEAHAQYRLPPTAPAERPSCPDQPTAARPSKPQVSSDTFFKVEPALGDLFAGQSAAGAGFSLLQMLGRDTEDGTADPTDTDYKTAKIKPKAKLDPTCGSANPFQYDSSSSEDEAEDGSTAAPPGGALPGWGQTRKFFLQPDDGRLAEGAEFVRAARSADELRQLASERRADLLELFRTQRHSRARVLRKTRGRGGRLHGR